MKLKCPYCKEDQILIKSLNFGDISWEDEYGCYWKRVEDATKEELEKAVISRDYCFKCCTCGSVLQHSYCNHEIVRKMERETEKTKKRLHMIMEHNQKKLANPTLFVE